jgi:hypothetical protein
MYLTTGQLQASRGFVSTQFLFSNPSNMLQLEIYTTQIEKNKQIFEKCFGFKLLDDTPNFKKFQVGSVENCELMLFDPNFDNDEQIHWQIQKGQKNLGVGVEIILIVQSVAGVRNKLTEFKYNCSEIIKKPWGSIEFDFWLEEGYFVRVKELV